MTLVLRGPNEASHIYGGKASGYAPRQRHVFMVRFQPSTAIHLQSVSGNNALTFVVKHTDRPRVIARNEELNQYNKKRQIYVGFRLEPIKMTFYDDANGAAQNLWNQYAQYYFNDFGPGAASAYGYDVTSSYIGNQYGLSEGYAGKGAADISAQWFFSNIEIFHFYYSGNQQMFDSYTLINPRITNYDPDELDYENCAVSQISMTFVYENLTYSPGQTVAGNDFNEFTSGLFNGNPPDAVPSATQTSPTGGQNNSVTPVNPFVGNLLQTATAATASAAPYRDVSTMASGALATFGNYLYGGTPTNTYAPYSATNVSIPLSTMGLVNAQQTGTAQYGFNNSATADTSPSNYLASLASSGSNGTVDSAPFLV